MAADSSSGKPPIGVSLEVEEFVPAGEEGDDPLTRNLKKVYDEIASEPIPDEWLHLLNQIDAKMKAKIRER